MCVWLFTFPISSMSDHNDVSFCPILTWTDITIKYKLTLKLKCEWFYISSTNSNDITRTAIFLMISLLTVIFRIVFTCLFKKYVKFLHLLFNIVIHSSNKKHKSNPLPVRLRFIYTDVQVNMFSRSTDSRLNVSIKHFYH